MRFVNPYLSTWRMVALIAGMVLLALGLSLVFPT